MSKLSYFDPQSVGQTLRQQRKARHLTQNQLANTLGVRRQTIADLEGGENVGSHLLLSAMTYLNLNFDPISLNAKEGLTNSENADEVDSQELFEISDKFDFPYDWPNPGNMPDDVLIMKVLKQLRFLDIVRLCKRFGVKRIDQEIKSSFYDDVRSELNEIMDIIHEATQPKAN